MGERSEMRTGGMACPDCGSIDAECHEDTVRHVHLCNACGHKDIYRGNDG